MDTITAPTTCKKCTGKGTNRAGDCGVCRGSGLVRVALDKTGRLIVTAAPVPK